MDRVCGHAEVAHPHAHSVAAAGPFALAPGDTADVVMLVVVGEGADRLDSVERLRANADAAAAALARSGSVQGTLKLSFVIGEETGPFFCRYLDIGLASHSPVPAPSGTRGSWPRASAMI